MFPPGPSFCHVMLIFVGSGTPETYTFNCPLEPDLMVTMSLTALMAGLAVYGVCGRDIVIVLVKWQVVITQQQCL